MFTPCSTSAARPPQPAELGHALGHRGLPLVNLVAVRIQRARQGHALGQVLRLGHRLDERADIRDKGGPSLPAAHARAIEEIRQSRAGGVQAVELAVATGILIQRLQLRDAEGQVAAGGGIDGVSCGVAGHEPVEGVIAAVEEETHERAVVRRRAAGRRVPGQVQVEQGVQHGYAAEGGAGGLAEKAAAVHGGGHGVAKCARFPLVPQCQNPRAHPRQRAALTCRARPLSSAPATPPILKKHEHSDHP